MEALPVETPFMDANLARLDDLEEKRANYKALSQKLFTLPQKLRHPGLIPVGPRLFMPGELVRTNELTVLLGASGEESYFAERSAFQAQGIVQRRLAHIDQRIRALSVSQQQVDDGVIVNSTLDHVRNAALASISEEACGDVLVTQAMQYQGNDMGVAEGAVVNPAGTVAEEQRIALNQDASPAKTGEGEPCDKPKRRVSFSEPLVTSVMRAPKRYSRNSGKKKKSGKKSARASYSASGRENAATVRSEFSGAINSARKQMVDEGIVNITEVFDKTSTEPSSVEFPHDFKPDKNINFNLASEEYLDVTGSGKPTEKAEEFSRDDILEALLELEQEDEIENNRKEAEEQEQLRKREEKEFGKGFSKGFFGAPKSKASAASRKKDPQRQLDEPKSEGLVQGSESPQAGISERSLAGEEMGAPVIGERIVERNAPRRGRRPKRKESASGILARRGMPSTHFINELTDPEMEPLSLMDDEAVSDKPQISKFRQMREMQRNSAS